MARSKKRKQKSDQPSLGMRYLRGIMGLLAIVLVVAFLGSFYMRHRVVSLLKERAVESFAVVMSRPFPLNSGLDIKGAHLLDRFERLRYQRVRFSPKIPGQYALGNNGLDVYLRGIRSGHQVKQDSQLVRVSLNAEKQITELDDLKYQRKLDRVWLEPELISLLGAGGRRVTTAKSLDEFNSQLVDAVISIEDERFYKHFGLDPWAITRAAVVNLQAGKVVQGGSTITQQLAKNLFLDSERSMKRKIVEAFSALLIETSFEKDQILELYLNEVFLGQEGRVAIHGFGEAAMSFFGKDVSAISLAEAATLAGIIKAPSYYSPRKHPERANRRRAVVLQKMRERDLITDAERQEALDEEIKIKPPQRTQRVAPYYVDYLRQMLGVSVDVERVGLSPFQLHTGLDLQYQRCARDAVEKGLMALEKRHPKLKKSTQPAQAGLIAIAPNSGEILAWVGGRNYGKNQFDHVSMAKRQPGSAFKPFVYLTALDSTLNDYRVARATSILVDKPVTLEIPGSEPWQPKNYDKKFRGDVTLRQSLAKSLNVPTVQLAMKVGIRNVAITADMFGFGSDLPQVPSLALGAGEVSPLELAGAYSVLANGGLRTELRPIVAITRSGKAEPVYTSPLEEQRVVTEPAVFVLTNILQSVIEHGTGRGVRRLGFDRPVAGKTGTSNEARDSWFAGYTPRLLAVVWVGYDDNQPLGLTGAQAALPLWTSFMKCTAAMEPELDFVAPSGIVYRNIDAQSGMLATAGCPNNNIIPEVFVIGSEPQTPCPLHSRRRYVDTVDDDKDKAAKRRARYGKKKKTGDSFVDRIMRNLWK